MSANQRFSVENFLVYFATKSGTFSTKTIGFLSPNEVGPDYSNIGSIPGSAGRLVAVIILEFLIPLYHFIFMRFLRLLSASVTLYVLLIGYIVVLGIATFVEEAKGTAFVREHFYYAWWFILLQGILGIQLIVIFFCRKWFRRQNWGNLLLHFSFLWILVGAAITHFAGKEGIMHIREGETVDYMFVGERMERQTVPFRVTLTDFRLKRYPGSHSPSSYESDLVVFHQGREEKVGVKMNKVVNVEGYRLFQSSYDPDERGTVLTVSYDCPGMQITYIGYVFMVLGFLGICFGRNSRFSRLRGEMSKFRTDKKVWLLLIGLFCVGVSGNAAPDVSREHAAEFGRLVVQNPKGRLEPVNTWTSAILRKCYQAKTYKGLTSDQVFLNLIANPARWVQEPFIKVKNRTILEKLGKTGQSFIAWQDILDEQGQYLLATEVEKAYEKSPAQRSSYENDLLKLDECVNIVYQIFQGQFLAIFPHEGDAAGKWYSAGDDLSVYQGKDSLFVARIMVWYKDELAQGLQNGNWTGADRVLEMIRTYQQAKNKVIPMDEQKIKAEILYNQADVFSWCRKFYLILGGLLLGFVFAWMMNEKKGLKIVCRALIFGIGTVFICHTLGLALRWYIAGYAPWTNSYESMVYAGWMIVLGGLVFARRFYVLPALSALLGGVVLFVAGLNDMNPEITPLVPVLQSYWLMLHVAVIMAGYGFFAICALIGLFNMSLILGVRPRNRQKIGSTIQELTLLNEMAMILGLVFMTTGTFLGAVWANESWGRYWGWDPKETWALISVVVYALVLHIRFIPGLSKSIFVFNMCSVWAIASVLMTYFGVNYYLSGLHSYGKSDAELMPWPFVIGIVVMIVISVLAGYKYKKIKLTNE